MFIEFKKQSWDKNDYIQLQNFLYQNVDATYREFNKKIVKTKLPLLGVRVPIIRKLASNIAKGNIRDYLKICKDETFEEALLHGFVLAKLKCDFKELIFLFDDYITVFENWAICDMTVSSLKQFTKNQKAGYDYLIECINSENPWKVRVGLLLMLSFYINEFYIDDIIKNCKFVSSRSFPSISLTYDYRKPDYYVKMGNAWLLSVCFIKFPAKTKTFLEKYEIDEKTYKMTVCKITDSKRVPNEQKLYLKKLAKNYPSQKV